MLRAVLFDVGGPIDTEEEHERLIDADIRACLAEEGVSVDDDRYAEACRAAVDSFAPNAYRAIIWALADHDAARAARVWQTVAQRAEARDLFALREGIADVIKVLGQLGAPLGLVANQPTKAIAHLKAAKLARYFRYRGVSGATGLRKPDPRAFLQACEALETEPARCIMVGDRIDNDIAPARMLGMKTIRLRTGRHAAQRPRSWDEVPDAEVDDVQSLDLALTRQIFAF